MICYLRTVSDPGHVMKLIIYIIRWILYLSHTYNDPFFLQACLKRLCVYTVACQAHPALVKTGLILARIFHFNGLYGLQGEQPVSRRGLEPRRFFGDPTPLARDNTYVNIKLKLFPCLQACCVRLRLMNVNQIPV